MRSYACAHSHLILRINSKQWGFPKMLPKTRLNMPIKTARRYRPDVSKEKDEEEIP
jgi:hypothetical protein